METATRRKRAGILINRNFALLWTGQVLSPIGDFFLQTTLILWITTQLARGASWLGVAIGGLELANALAILGIGPLAGVFVDRWNKRRTMQRMDVLCGLLLLLLLILTGLLPAPLIIQLPLAGKLIVIYAVLFLVSACGQFYGPSRGVLLRDIVEKEQLAQASGLFSAAFNLALILGPSTAAPLFLFCGARWAMLIDAASFFASYLCTTLILLPPETYIENGSKRRSYLAELRAGWKVIVSNRAIAALIIIGVLLFTGAGASDAFYVVFGLSNLHIPASLAGLLGPAYGVGVIVASLPAAWLARRLGEGKMLGLAILVWGLLTVVLSRCTGFVPGLIVLGLTGMANGCSNVCVGPLLLHLTPRQYVGRVSAVMNPGITLASMLSAGLAGYLISGPLLKLHVAFLGTNFGGLDTVFLAVGLIEMLTGLYALSTVGTVVVKKA